MLNFYFLKDKTTFFFIILFYASSLSSQQLNIPLEKGMTDNIARFASDSTSHLSMQPFLESDFDLKNVPGYAKDSTKYYYKFLKIIRSQNLIEVNKENFKLTVNPILNFEWGLDFANQRGEEKNKILTKNTRGFQIKGNITNKFSFQTSFYENQSVVPLYLDSIAREIQVYPGQGRIKFSPNSRKLDYAFSEGSISYSPSKHFNIQFGHGKHFIGNGYRSMLLSDAAFNYPYLKFRLNVFKNKIQYTALYASLQSLERLPLGDSPESTFKRKSLSIHYLSYTPNKFIEIGIFESLIWKRFDDNRGTLPFNYNQINPVPIIGTAIYGFSNENNASLGANLLLKPTRKIWIYGQCLVDDLNDNKMGYQVGFKFFDAIKNLILFAEYNSAKPYTYTTNLKLQNYTHYNQSLAHPLGTGFDEIYAGANYTTKNYFVNANFSFSKYIDGLSNNPNPSINFGSSILLSDAAVPQNAAKYRSTITAQNLIVGYVINPKTNFKIYIGYLGRNLKNRNTDQKTDYFCTGISTTIFNNYYDF